MPEVSDALLAVIVYGVPVVPGSPGADERLVRPGDVPAADKGRVMAAVGRPVALGAWPLHERAAGYAAR